MLAPAPDDAQDSDVHEVLEQQPAKQQVSPSELRAAHPETPTKNVIPKRKAELIEEPSHMQDMATAQLLEQKLKSIQYLISISEGEEERKHLKSVLYDEVMNGTICICIYSVR